MYVNQHLADRQFAFLRKADDELMLVVANFSGEPVACDVNIPRHAFEYLGIIQKEVTATDLLTGEALTMQLHAGHPVHMTIEPYTGRIYKMKG